MSRREIAQAVLTVGTPGTAVKMNDGWPSDEELLKTDFASAMVAQAERRSHRAGSQRSAGGGRRSRGDCHHLLGVQLRFCLRTRLNLGHIRLRSYATECSMKDNDSMAAAGGAH